MKDAIRCLGQDKEDLSKYFNAGVTGVFGEPSDFLCPDFSAGGNGKICNTKLWSMGEK